MGRDSEYLQFKGFENNSEMDVSGTYTLFFDEISTSIFNVGIKLTEDVNFSTGSIVLENQNNVYLYDGSINVYTLTSDINFIFPPAITDDEGYKVPRAFELYVK